MLQVEDALLKRREIMLNDVITAHEHAPRIDTFVGRCLIASHFEGTVTIKGLQHWARLTKAAIYRVASHPKDPHEKRGLPLIGRQRAQQGNEDFLGDVFGFARVAQPLQRKAVHAWEIGFVKEVKLLKFPTEDLVHEFSVGRPGLFFA